MTRKGICKNYANCDTADASTILEIPDGGEFICPDCKKLLQSPEGGEVKEFKGPVTKRPWIAWCMGAGILLSLYFVGAALWNWMQGEPRIQLSATSVVFDYKQIGKGEASQEIEIRNTGQSGTLDVFALRSSSPEFTTRKLAYSVRPGQAVRLEILYKPTTPGQHDATLTLASDDVTQPEVTIHLSGRAGKLGPWWIWEQWEQASKVFEK